MEISPYNAIEAVLEKIAFIHCNLKEKLLPDISKQQLFLTV